MTDSSDLSMDPAALIAELQRLRVEHKDISDAVVALEALEKQSLARSKSKDDQNPPKKEKVAKAA